MSQHQPPPCPDCGSEPPAFLVNAEGHDVCSECGLIQGGSGILAPAPHWQEEATETAAATAGSRKRRALGPVRHRHISSKERWIERLRSMAVRAGLNRGISDTATRIYRRASEMKEWKNRKYDYQVGLLVACLFHACNIHHAHRTPSELCSLLDVDPRNTRKMVKVVERAAREVSGNARRCLQLPPAVPTSATDVPYEVLPRCAYRIENVPLDQLGRVRKLAKTFYEAVRSDIDNHRPDTITAGLLSVVLRRAEIPVNDAEIAEACLVAPNTVRSIANRMSAILQSKNL